MKIVPITLLKVGAKATIEEIVDDVNTERSQKLIKHLTAVGFVPGKDVRLEGKHADIFSIRAGTDNPFAMGKDIASKFRVSAEDTDVFESEASMKKSESIVNDFKKLIDFIKSKTKKN